MGLVLVTPPTGPALLNSDAKLHARITYADEDSEITALIQAAQRYYEQVAGVQLCTATYDQFWHSLPRSEANLQLHQDLAPWGNGKLWIDRPPLVSVTWIKYYDDTQTLQTLDPSLYQVDATGQRGFIVPAAGQLWPEMYPGLLNAFNVRFVCGFDAPQGSNVPATALHYMREWVCRHFKEEGREGGTKDPEPPGMEALFWAERCLDFV
ncbi:MAG: phage head-tail connector protein [Elusimicrobia bacterium]|nr:phage head-tail connector protein [Elusimicrobiota bacterium]